MLLLLLLAPHQPRPASPGHLVGNVYQAVHRLCQHGTAAAAAAEQQKRGRHVQQQRQQRHLVSASCLPAGRTGCRTPASVTARPRRACGLLTNHMRPARVPADDTCRAALPQLLTRLENAGAAAGAIARLLARVRAPAVADEEHTQLGCKDERVGTDGRLHSMQLALRAVSVAVATRRWL